MMLRKVQEIKNLSGRRVLLRLDLNVSLGPNGRVDPAEAWRLQRALPTIRYLVRRRAKVIMVAHLGRPQGRVVPALSLRPMARYLSRALGQKIALWPLDLRFARTKSKTLGPGELAMLENIRWHRGEQKNSSTLARQLASLADIYVSDAFGNIHRSDISMLAITKFLPSYAGLLLQAEVKNLSLLFDSKKSRAIILGGAKIRSKIKLIKKFAQAGPVLLGGALANTLLWARGYETGHSLVEKLPLAKKLKSKNIFLPQDVVVAASLSAKKSRRAAVDKIRTDEYIADLGPQTIMEYQRLLRGKKVIAWNGPLGYFENPKFRRASRVLLAALAKSRARVIIGGGETVTMLRQLKLENKFSFVSTGGGAMLAFLQGERLPALTALRR